MSEKYFTEMAKRIDKANNHMRNRGIKYYYKDFDAFTRLKVAMLDYSMTEVFECENSVFNNFKNN